MTEKQYHVQRIYKGMDGGVKYYDWCVMKDDTVILRLTTRMDCKDVVEVLNELLEENKKLQGKYDQQLWLYNGLGCEYDWLKEENEQLKQQFNYIQNSISEHIKHQKTELGQKALQEIIEDYNEWLLRHKEVKE